MSITLCDKAEFTKFMKLDNETSKLSVKQTQM